MTFRYFDFNLFFGEGEFERGNGRKKKKKRTNIDQFKETYLVISSSIYTILFEFRLRFIVDRSNSRRNEMKRFRKLIFNL